MRRIIAALLALLCLFGAWGVAESGVVSYGNMMVDNCEEWVSLRDVPGTGGNRLAKVPLYAIVTDAEWTELYGDFIHCCYDGQYGYILAKYLVPWADPEPGDEAVMDVTLNGLRVLAERSYVNDGEYLLVTCRDEAGVQRWFRETMTEDITELTLTDAFMGGAAQDPMVMVFNAEQGLAAIDLFSGETRWELTRAECDLGASVSHAVSGDGTLYIGGYYGPDPVAIDASGHVLWRSDSDGCYWLYRLELEGDRLEGWYDVMDGDNDLGAGKVLFDLNGERLSKLYTG